LAVLDVLCHGTNPAMAIITDIQSFRLETARKLGAEYAINIEQEDPVARVMEITQGEGADCVIECVGHFHEIAGRAAPLQQAVQMIRNGGRIVTCGLGDQLSPVHFKTLVIKEATMIASRVTLGEFPRAIRLMAKGLLHPELHVTHKLPLHEISTVFAQVDQEDPHTIKVVLDIQRA
jgi:threonine dehydrogenase-like Zn-dependent dehydrogenase